MANEINIWDVMIILFVHWFADFVLQTDWQAKNKSKSNDALLSHTAAYSLAWLIIGGIIIVVQVFSQGSIYHTPTCPCKNFPWLGVFVVITFIAHTITDYFTSRLNARLWKAQKSHEFFVSVGFDQFLHFAQLLITYQLLK